MSSLPPCPLCGGTLDRWGDGTARCRTHATYRPVDRPACPLYAVGFMDDENWRRLARLREGALEKALRGIGTHTNDLLLLQIVRAALETKP